MSNVLSLSRSERELCRSKSIHVELIPNARYDAFIYAYSICNIRRLEFPIRPGVIHVIDGVAHPPMFAKQRSR